VEFLVKVWALALAGSVLAISLVEPVQAKEGDTFRPFVSYARYYDNNLFRLDDDGDFTIVLEDGVPVVVTRESASDHYGVLSAGLSMDWRPGRQQVLASASRSQVRFSRYTSLDYDGSDYQLRWNWRLGSHLSGRVGATETVTQTSFADWYSVLVVNNEVTRDDRFANAEWQFHPRWSVGLGAATAESTNSTLLQAAQDYEDTIYTATLTYVTPKGGKLRGQLRRVEGEYPRRPPSLFVDSTYTQTEYNLLADWSTTGKLVTRAKFGYVQRENGTLSQRDFAGPAGRLTADYSPTGKSALSWAIYRELANSDDINATYRVDTGSSLGALWQAQSKLALRANASFVNRSFRGDSGFSAPGTPRREEDVLSGSLSLSYTPVTAATIDLGVQAGSRDSNISDSDYTFHSVFVSVRAEF
jgi:exopolysaccharide biosynthesis operon protein EpsL